jgi:HEAT repeat protein
MDGSLTSPAIEPRGHAWLLLIIALVATGCTTFVGTTARSFLGHVRNNPDPNVRYLAYAKLADPDAYDSPEQRDEAVQTLMDKFANGREPVATRAMICRTLGELRDPRARELLVKAVSNSEPVIKIEACRALGKVGRPEDATVLAQVMTLDNLEDARIAAIEGLAQLKTTDSRIFKLLLDGMDHDDPAIRLASWNALRKLIRKDLGTDPAAWRRELKMPADAAAPESAKESVPAVTGDTPAPVPRH